MKKGYVPQDDKRKRLDAMARLFTKSDTVLSGTKIHVEVTGASFNAPSWTDGETITFNREMIGDVQSVEDVVRVLGLNHHELAHVLYTPRNGTALVSKVIQEGLGQAFNLLEDQRIETFLTAQYPSSIPYLVSTFMRYCLMTDSAWESNFALMYGRRYLPKEVRQEFRARFKRQDLIPRFEEIIDRYRKLVFPTDDSEALALIRDYQRLLTDMAAQDGLHPQDPNGHHQGRPGLDEGKPVPREEQEEASQASDAFDDVFDDDDSGSDDSDDTGDTGSGTDTEDTDDAADGTGDGDGDDSADPDAPSDVDGNASGKTPDNPADDDTDDQSSGSGGGVDRDDVDAPAPRRSDSDLRDLMDDIAKSFEDLDEVKDEVADAQKTIVNGDGDISTQFDKGYFHERPVQPDDTQAARMFAKQLERLRAEADPGWNTRQSSGRLNVKRYMDGNPLDVVFDRWDEGHSDVADIECVVLIDTSGSMRSQIVTASRAMWTIKRGLETLDASVTVFGYDSSTTKVYDSHENVDRGVYRSLSVTGWTKPRTAIAEALHVLSSTRRSNRIFIVITDGRWDDEPLTPETPYSANDLIQEMNRQEITTALAFIDSMGYGGVNDHGCTVATSIRSAADLVEFAKRIVVQTMKFSVVK